MLLNCLFWGFIFEFTCGNLSGESGRIIYLDYISFIWDDLLEAQLSTGAKERVILMSFGVILSMQIMVQESTQRGVNWKMSHPK